MSNLFKTADQGLLSVLLFIRHCLYSQLPRINLFLLLSSPLLLLKKFRDGGLGEDRLKLLVVRSFKTAQNYDKEVPACTSLKIFSYCNNSDQDQEFTDKEQTIEVYFFVKNISIFSSIFSSFLHRIIVQMFVQI